MNTSQKLNMMEKKATLSTLWIVVLLNMLFRDIHEFFREAFFDDLFASEPVAEETLFVAGIALSIFIAMVFMSRVLPYKINRWANIIVALLMILAIVTNPPKDLDDIWFLLIEIAALIGIIGYAWTWATQKHTFAASH